MFGLMPVVRVCSKGARNPVFPFNAAGNRHLEPVIQLRWRVYVREQRGSRYAIRPAV